MDVSVSDMFDGMVVSTPRWNRGHPVRIDLVQPGKTGVSVRWQDAHLHGHAHLDTVPAGFKVNVVRDCVRGAR